MNLRDWCSRHGGTYHRSVIHGLVRNKALATALQPIEESCVVDKDNKHLFVVHVFGAYHVLVARENSDGTYTTSRFVFLDPSALDALL
ncbi:MAG: hypothetical protein GXO39_01660 [Thermotogae bacterium]|nr:hypothetical protein [Thermotogota bacterium]